MLGEMAELPIVETLAEVEKELDAEGRHSVWDRALGNLRRAGIAAGVVIGAAEWSRASHRKKCKPLNMNWCARLGSNQQPLPSEFYQRATILYKSMPYATRKLQNQG